ncbi:SDR family NAD(P)-dependent oxidoreductase [Lysobacter sp. D1-1-M9]|uniref:SDR family NAD(P)-dependent oxidoreductase n=1 Tax=Novilysobacter longmucuonensis TaxID=3098603 RepID=UPI0031FFBDB1
MSGTVQAPVVVLGGTGVVGRGIVAAAVARGRPVIAVARNASALDALQREYAQACVSTLVGSVASDAEGARLAAALRTLRRPFAGVIVAVCGAAERGRLLDQPAAFLQRKLDLDLLPHLAAARYLLPLLAESDRGGSYVLIGGPGSEHPWAGYGHRSIGAAALRMLARVLHDEARALAVRVQLLTVDTPVCRAQACARSSPQWPSALAVGQRALALVDRDADAAPAQEVVRYAGTSNAARALPLSLPRQSGEEGRLRAPGSKTPVSALSQGRAPTTPPPSDTGTLPLPVRCLHDARALLDALASPALPPNPHQEPSS